jgi:NAD(P)-dependent dehydrogenase (short-subunit alcohol dehydrogenase family)
MTDESLLNDEVAIVTGGASGNGRAIALEFARRGADVVVADITETPRGGGRPTHRRIREDTDSDALSVDCDVTDVGDLSDAVDAAEGFGGVTVMVNNAGITESRPFLETTEAEYDRVTDINLDGVFFGSQAAARAMIEGDRSGSIINISSTSGVRGRGDGVAYCAAKGGVTTMTMALADALAPDIRVNAVLPDLTETEMAATDLNMVGTESGEEYVDRNIPLNRTGRPEDVASAVVYLASDMASYVTGHSLTVDGGVTATK